MRKLIYAICLLAMFCNATLLPFISAFDVTQTISEVFGLARSLTEDIIALEDGSILRGSLLDEVVGIITPYSDLLVPIRKCAGISFSSTGADSIITVNHNRLTGIMYTREFRFRVGSIGAVTTIRKEKIKHIILRQGDEEAAFVSALKSTGVLVMANGDILSGKPGPGEIAIKTIEKSVKVDLDDIDKVVLRTASQLAADILMADGAELLGKLDTEYIDIAMDIGIYVEKIYFSKLKELYLGKNAHQIAASYLNEDWVNREDPTTGMAIGEPAKELTLKIPGSTAELKMKLIPSGSFIMGSPDTEIGRYDDEGPQHKVTITEPFYIGIYEVTQEQWTAVMGNNPSYFKGDNNPVERVSWDDCQEFITALNKKGIGTFRLPTEAEWEYACRAGSTTRFPWGDDSGYTQLSQYAWYDANSSLKTHPAGQKKPNAWGIYDMQGNVYEWCADWYASYIPVEQTDPSGPVTGSNRVSRGGSWFSDLQFCRSANRNDYSPDYSINYVGLRLVRNARK